MEIKGSAVKVTYDYVKNYFPDRLNEWIQSLPNESKTIFQKPIYATEWFPLSESVIIPTRQVGVMFFNSNEIEAGLAIGRYSAEMALKGIYKIFVRISTPQFVLSRATSVFSTYYNHAEITIIETSSNKAILDFNQFERKDELIMHRVSGWIEKTLDITLKKSIKMNLVSRYEGDILGFTITAQWE